MPFGLTKAPATLCRFVDALFGPELEPNVFAYLVDIIVVSTTYEEHLESLKFVQDRLVNREKCEFCCSRVLYLGFLLDEKGLRPDSEKIIAMPDFSQPFKIQCDASGAALGSVLIQENEAGEEHSIVYLI